MIDRALKNNHLSFVCSSVWTCLDIAVMVDQALKTSYLSFVRTTLKVKEVTLCFEIWMPEQCRWVCFAERYLHSLPGEGFGVGMSGLAHKPYSQRGACSHVGAPGSAWSPFIFAVNWRNISLGWFCSCYCKFSVIHMGLSLLCIYCLPTCLRKEHKCVCMCLHPCAWCACMCDYIYIYV